MDDLLDALARLDARVETLERRVEALEGAKAPAPPLKKETAVAAESHAAGGELTLPPAGGVFPVVGRAMLGIAGAYLLRAAAESGSFPRLAVVVIALAYAAMWMVWASRVRSSVAFSATAYAATSALILAPMLAELMLRFQVLSASATAGLLSAFVLGTFALSWRRKLTATVAVAVAAAVVTALGLLVVSHDLPAYISALLVAVAASEFAAGAGRWSGLRFLAAPAADVAVLILVYIHSLPETSRPGYAPVSQGVLLALPTLLFVIAGTGIVWRTVVHRYRINLFEIAQAAVAFALTAAAWLWFVPAKGGLVVGVCCWLFAFMCYALAFGSFDRVAEQRNYHVYATWAAALMLAGSFLLLPPLSVTLLLSVAAIVATVIGVRVARLTPEFHGLLYLTAAAYSSGLLQYAGRALVGSFPAAPGWIVWMVAVAALACFAIGGRFEGERWNERLLRLLAAVLAVSAVATFLVSCLVWLAAIGMRPEAAHVAVIRTLITCGLAMLVAASGSRWKRAELVWTAYGMLAAVSAKLLLEDLPHGHSGAIAVSIFLYAVTLILVPRMARSGRGNTEIPGRS